MPVFLGCTGELDPAGFNAAPLGAALSAVFSVDLGEASLLAGFAAPVLDLGIAEGFFVCGCGGSAIPVTALVRLQHHFIISFC
jgi:hypothetical protein